jgi:hypothetical protein
MVFKRVLNWILGLKLLWNGSPAKLRSAIRRADRLCAKTRKRHRVYFMHGRYIAMTRNQVQNKKRCGDWNRNVNVTKLEDVEYYDTLCGLSPEGRRILKTNQYGNAIGNSKLFKL